MSNDAGDSQSWPHQVIPVLIDLSTLAGLLFLVPWLGARLFAPSAVNHILLAPGFILIPAGIIAIRCLPGRSGNYGKSPPRPPIFLVFFQMIVYLLGYAYGADIGGSESNNDGATVILFFVFLPFVIGAFYLPTRRAVPGTGKALAANSIGLISVNYLTLIGAAVWDYFCSLPTGENPVYATGITFLVLYAILYVLFLAFFGLPRLYLLRSTGDRTGLALYLLGLAVFLWNKVPPVN